jgi:hypothetical protein
MESAYKTSAISKFFGYLVVSYIVGTLIWSATEYKKYDSIKTYHIIEASEKEKKSETKKSLDGVSCVMFYEMLRPTNDVSQGKFGYQNAHDSKFRDAIYNEFVNGDCSSYRKTRDVAQEPKSIYTAQQPSNEKTPDTDRSKIAVAEKQDRTATQNSESNPKTNDALMALHRKIKGSLQRAFR